MTRMCIFAGPTLYEDDVPPGIERFGPAAMGAIFRAAEAGYRRIGLIDGYFGSVPSVWHKEILFAMAAGVEVVGAASMGALRAAELSAFGMVGIGRIYRLYRSGRWTDDDEVAIIHAPEALGYYPLSHAMANIRYTLRRLCRLGLIEPVVARALVVNMKAKHFSQRTQKELARQLEGNAKAQPIMQRFDEEYVDVKKQDARALIAYLARNSSGKVVRRAWAFPATGHWRKQFVQDIADIPQLT